MSSTFTSGGSSPIDVAGLVNGQPYRSRIRAHGPGGVSAWSDWSGTFTPQAAAAPTNMVVVSGSNLAVDGVRWIARGVCQYVVYPQSGWWYSGSPQERFYLSRQSIAAYMSSLGINVLRLSVYSGVYNGVDSALTSEQWRGRLGDLCTTFTAHGIRVIICDHQGTGIGASWVAGTLAEFRASHFPMATDLVQDPRIGGNPMVMFEPMNEPGPFNGGGSGSFSELGLTDHYRLVIDHYRVAGYRGVLIVDGHSWAWGLTSSFASALTSHDANVCFANHRYPKDATVGPSLINGKKDGYDESDRARHVHDFLGRGDSYPILVTELGQNIDDLNEDANPARTAWYEECLTAMATDITVGRVDGVTAWMWAWDEGSSGHDGDNRLSGIDYWGEHGQTTLSEYGAVTHRTLWAANGPQPELPPPGMLASFHFASFAPSTAHPDLAVSHIRKNPHAPVSSWLRLRLHNSPDAYASRPALQVHPVEGATSASVAVTAGSFFEFTISPRNGAAFTAQELRFSTARGGSSTPRGYDVRTSVDGYATSLGAADVNTVRPTWSAASVDLSSLGTRSAPVTIRIHAYSPTSGNTVEFDDICISGSVTPAGA